jgi:hypothetical protein
MRKLLAVNGKVGSGEQESCLVVNGKVGSDEKVASGEWESW